MYPNLKAPSLFQTLRTVKRNMPRDLSFGKCFSLLLVQLLKFICISAFEAKSAVLKLISFAWVIRNSFKAVFKNYKSIFQKNSMLSLIKCQTISSLFSENPNPTNQTSLFFLEVYPTIIDHKRLTIRILWVF